MLAIVAVAVAAQACLDPRIPIETHVKTPQPWEYMKNEELPKAYDP